MDCEKPEKWYQKQYKKTPCKNLQKILIVKLFLSLQICKNTERNKKKKIKQLYFLIYYLEQAVNIWKHYFITFQMLPPSPHPRNATLFYFHVWHTQQTQTCWWKHKFNLICEKNGKKLRKKGKNISKNVP